MRLALLLVGVGVSLSGCGQCQAVCLSQFVLVLSGANGQRLAPSSGTITAPGAGPLELDCRPADGGVGTEGCGVDRVTLYGLGDGTVVKASVRAASGESFVGEFTVSMMKTGQRVCGTDCTSGSTTITLE